VGGGGKTKAVIDADTQRVKPKRKTRKDKKQKNQNRIDLAHSDKPGIGMVRLNCQFCLKSGVPTGISVNGSDGVHESTAAQAFVEPDHLYVFDSGIVSFNYLSSILNAGSHLLCNLSKIVGFTVEQDRALTPADIKAGVISDRIGVLTGSNCNTPPNAKLREIVIQYTDRSGNIQHLRLLSDLLDIAAASVGQLYQQRWKIELFFRWLKVSANFSHLCSHSKNGISLSFHVAVIAALLMVLRTGRELSIYGYSLMGMVASGQADLQHILPILEHREREKRLARERLARIREAKKLA
jgi:hypothetical protein